MVKRWEELQQYAKDVMFLPRPHKVLLRDIGNFPGYFCRTTFEMREPREEEDKPGNG